MIFFEAPARSTTHRPMRTFTCQMIRSINGFPISNVMLDNAIPAMKTLAYGHGR